MSLADEIGAEGGGDDILAAEYVLGVLPWEERRIVGRRLDTDATFARMVDRWEVHLAPLATGYAAVEPPASVKPAIDRRLFSSPAATVAAPTLATSGGGLWASLAFWRGLTVASLIAMATFIALLIANPPVAPEQAQLVASLAADGSEVRYLAAYDAEKGSVALSRVAGEAGTGKDFELWMIEGGNAPVSMGLIPAGDTARIAVSDTAKEKLGTGAVLAISLEPTGGSPTGQPTGPVVAAGDLRSIFF